MAVVQGWDYLRTTIYRSPRNLMASVVQSIFPGLELFWPPGMVDGCFSFEIQLKQSANQYGVSVHVFWNDYIAGSAYSNDNHTSIEDAIREVIHRESFERIRRMMALQEIGVD